MASVFPHPGNGLALVPAQRLERQPGLPQVDLCHGQRHGVGMVPQQQVYEIGEKQIGLAWIWAAGRHY